MGAGTARTAGLARTAAIAACALMAAPAAMIAAPAWQYPAAPSAQHELATRIASGPAAPPVPADVADARMDAAEFTVAALPQWVDHGSSCPFNATRPLWVSHGSAAPRFKPDSASNVAV